MYLILVCLGVFIFICWISSELMIKQEYKNRYNPEKYSKNRQLKLISEAIDNMDYFVFEEFCTQLFILGGLKAKTTPKTNDGGKDIIVKDDKGIIYIECKHYSETNKITVNLIHKLISACTVDGVDRAIFLTTSSFTSTAIELIKKCKTVDIETWYKNDILHYCEKIDMLELLVWLGYDKNEVLEYCTIA